MSEWGNPFEVMLEDLDLVSRRTLGELKHLSSQGKENKSVIPLVVASERGTAQTFLMLKAVAVVKRGLQGISSGSTETSIRSYSL